MVRRGGRGSLLGTIGRTAVVAGTASATVNAVNRRHHQRDVEQQQAAAFRAQQQVPAAAPAAPAAGGADLLEELRKLGELRDANVITAQEFETLKAKALAAS